MATAADLIDSVRRQTELLVRLVRELAPLLATHPDLGAVEATVVRLHAPGTALAMALGEDGRRPQTEKRRRRVEVDLAQMYERGQITLAERNAGERVQQIFDRIEILSGGGRSTIAALESRVSGGGDPDCRMIALIDAAKSWADVSETIRADAAASAHAGERAALVNVLELVLRAGMSFSGIERAGGLGRRNVVRKRFKTALASVARQMGARDQRPRPRFVRDADAVPGVGGEQEAA